MADLLFGGHMLAVVWLTGRASYSVG